MSSALEQLRSQWRSNRRLRVATGLAGVVLVLNLVAGLDDRRAEAIAEYQRQHDLLQRLEGAAADGEWTARAEAAATARSGLEEQITGVAGPGEARAELQAQLTALASASGLGDIRVRTEGAVPVEDLPDVWLVVARVDASATPVATEAFLRDLAARLWIQVERVEVRDGAPGQIQMIVNGVFREAVPEGEPSEEGA
jgi:hypothetical protein